MQKTMPLIVAVVASLATGGCSKGTNPTSDAAKITEEIKAQDAQWDKDYAAKDVNAIEAHYANDGVLAGPGYVGSTDAERRHVLTHYLADPNYKQTFSPDRVDVASSGDLATSRGHYSMTWTDPATKQPITVSGSYLTAYRKDSDASWKATARFLTRGPMPEATAAKPDAAATKP